MEGAFEPSLDRNSGRLLFSGTKPGRATVQPQDAPPPCRGITKTHSFLSVSYLRIAVTFRWTFQVQTQRQDRVGPESYKNCADARAVASKVLKASMMKLTETTRDCKDHFYSGGILKGLYNCVRKTFKGVCRRKKNLLKPSEKAQLYDYTLSLSMRITCSE